MIITMYIGNNNTYHFLCPEVGYELRMQLYCPQIYIIFYFPLGCYSDTACENINTSMSWCLKG